MGEDTEDSSVNDEVAFHQKLDYLRGHATVFLKMLNDMRRRLKELPTNAAAAVQYRYVLGISLYHLKVHGTSMIRTH